jgi:ribosomal protein L14
MIQVLSTLDVADNSGAKTVQCIKVLGGQILALKHERIRASVKADRVARRDAVLAQTDPRA